MDRPTCSVFIATSIDGFIAGQNDSLDFLKSVEVQGEDYGFAAFFSKIDTMIMGRATYDVVSTFPEWAYKGKEVIVLTHRPVEGKHGERAYSGDLRALLRTLKGRVYVDGGAVISQFLALGVIDELTLSTIPVLLGRGSTLFHPVDRGASFVVSESRSYKSGLVQTTFKRAPTIQTKRLVLRPFRKSDAQALHEALSDPEAMRYWSRPPHTELSQSVKFVDDTLAAKDVADFIVEHEGEVIGKAGLWFKNEIGFLFARRHWRKGFAFEALSALCDHGLNVLNYESIKADVDPRNEASLALLQKLGFEKTGSAERTFNIGGEWVDSVYLSKR